MSPVSNTLQSYMGGAGLTWWELVTLNGTPIQRYEDHQRKILSYFEPVNMELTARKTLSNIKQMSKLTHLGTGRGPLLGGNLPLRARACYCAPPVNPPGQTRCGCTRCAVGMTLSTGFQLSPRVGYVFPSQRVNKIAVHIRARNRTPEISPVSGVPKRENWLWEGAGRFGNGCLWGNGKLQDSPTGFGPKPSRTTAESSPLTVWTCG